MPTSSTQTLRSTTDSVATERSLSKGGTFKPSAPANFIRPKAVAVPAKKK